MRSRHHIVQFALLAIAAHAIGFAVAPHLDRAGGGDDLGSPIPIESS